jgi:hypothetical protein
MTHFFQRRTGPKAEYQEQQKQRVIESHSLSDQFPKLKSLTAILKYNEANSLPSRSQLKYVVNIANAKSVFRFKCPNSECIGGDFDLSKELARAVGKRRASVKGEMACKGNTINRVRCGNILNFSLRFGY